MIKTSPYPQMSIESFTAWFDDLRDRYPNESQYIIDTIANDEVSDDNELQQHLIACGVNSEYVKELIAMREYFWDFGYCQNINVQL